MRLKLVNPTSPETPLFLSMILLNIQSLTLSESQAVLLPEYLSSLRTKQAQWARVLKAA